jgi:hypothetical protein
MCAGMNAVARDYMYVHMLSEEKYTGAIACGNLDLNSNPKYDLSFKSNCIRTAGRIVTQTPEMELLVVPGQAQGQRCPKMTPHLAPP